VVDLILLAIPAFFALMAVELAAYRWLPDDDAVGYERRDSLTSLSMGLGNVFVNVGWKLALLGVYTALYELTPLRVGNHWWAWLLLLFGEDLCYYWFHRAHHEVRFFWASHVVHHSSRHYNLSTALRQTWTPMTGLPFWLVLPLLGFPPWTVFTQQSISLLYQFWIHTERIDRLPRPVELVMNTPSHHRVHHGSNPAYLDSNYGGIFIIWDRLFGTFVPETERVVFGLTKNIHTFKPWRVAFHEYADLLTDVRSARGWRTRVGHVVHGPGWSPAALAPAAPAAASTA
jgi:sterol desaturase/sphingolipid hydroxylase (fatty acid hydroxylase superfamily)